MSSTQLKDILKIKGIKEEPNTYEHNYVEPSDDEEEPIKEVLSSHSDTSEKDDNEELCVSDDSEVCGAIASNKFSILNVSD
jgi:hypothetical protein